jgi:hypothetical protein
MFGNKKRWLSVLVTMALIFPMLGSGRAHSQGNSRTFPETGKTVSGQFLQYWLSHGGLPQQGYPISEEMQEVSETDGKSYTVQYFERAVFESHPENSPPNDVLLSLLGVFLYRQTYSGSAGAPGQVPNTDAGSVLFSETGKRVGGLFLEYWRANGALAQQGYPISDELTEVSKLDGKSYKVQYFERAVFEHHPENQAPYNVLLSQLGTFRYRDKYVAPATPTAQPVPTSPSAQPTATAAADLCSGIPASGTLTVTPNCGPAGTTFVFDGWGFIPGEDVGIYATLPSGEVYGTVDTDEADSEGKVKGWYVNTDSRSPNGIWAATMEGLTSHYKAIGYFKVTPPVAPDCSGVPAGVNVVVTPNCAPAGTSFRLEARGFQLGEQVSLYFTTPNGQVFGGSTSLGVDSEGRLPPVTFRTTANFDRGIWAATFEGRRSHNISTGYFKIHAP